MATSSLAPSECVSSGALKPERLAAVVAPAGRLRDEPARERLWVVLKLDLGALLCHLIDRNKATLVHARLVGWEGGHGLGSFLFAIIQRVAMRNRIITAY